MDALRYDYVNPELTPFIYSLKKKGNYGCVLPSFGFEPDAAYLSGLSPEESNTGTQFFYDPSNSPFSWTRIIPNVIDKLPPSLNAKLRNKLTVILNKMNRSDLLTIANIPLKLLPFFNQTFQNEIDSPNYIIGKETIFNHLQKNNVPYYAYSLPRKVDIETIINTLKYEILPEKCAYIFLLVGNLDLAGHLYGPASDEMKRELQKVDHGIKIIYEILKSKYDNIGILFFGDHGMIQVDSLVDIQKELLKIPFKLKKDYLLFIDSTMARFWFFNEDVKKTIISMLNKRTDGKLLNDSDKKKYDINYIDNRFGDAIFILNPGNIFFPNFYQKYSHVNGMHGYLPDIKGQQSSFILNHTNYDLEIEPDIVLDMRELYKIMMRILCLDDLSI
jgi:predicted AlkP superfamily pyrophosphatase or phosphodiesterase